MSLPVPQDPDFEVNPSEDEFFNPKGQEDDALLATGAWGPPEAVEEEPAKAQPRKVHVHLHRK